MCIKQRERKQGKVKKEAETEESRGGQLDFAVRNENPEKEKGKTEE